MSAYTATLGDRADQKPALVAASYPRPSTLVMTSVAMEIYTHHADSRHSWLQVPITELFTLGVAHKISPYSYTDGTYAYLNEEDTVTFWWAREAMSQPCPCERQLRTTADPSPVRSLDRFAAPKAENGAGTIKIVAGFDSMSIA